MYWIREYEHEDLVQVYEESELYNGWKIVLQMHGIQKFNEMYRHNYR